MTHELKETESIDVNYPDHEHGRIATALFHRTRAKLIDHDKLGCFICGTREHLELHHAKIEYSLSEAVDWNKVRADHQDFNWESFLSDTDFIDSEYNGMVLCAKHHRDPVCGIHHTPYPFWIAQRYVKDDFKLFANEKGA